MSIAATQGRNHHQRYFFALSNLPKTLSKYAIPLISLYAIANLPKADGGPLSYSACCLSCTTVAPPLFPACVAACLVTLFLPSP